MNKRHLHVHDLPVSAMRKARLLLVLSVSMCCSHSIMKLACQHLYTNQYVLIIQIAMANTTQATSSLDNNDAISMCP